MAVNIIHAKPADTERIMRLVKRQYGNLNNDRTLYDKDALYAEIAAGNYRFRLAECDGTDAGLVCLKKNLHFTGTFEGCTLSVLPEFRRHGIAKMLMDAMRENFANIDAASIFYSVLTTTLTEQNREYENGFIPTGFALDRFLFDMGAVNITVENLPERRHHLFMVQPVKKTLTARLFIPPVLDNFVRNIYDNLNVKIGDKETKPAPSEVLKFPENRYIEFYGAISAEIPSGTAANLFLDMTDKNTPERFTELAVRGWRFTGIKPLQERAEYIIMHKGDINAGLDASKTLTEFEAAKEEIRRLGNA